MRQIPGLSYANTGSLAYPLRTRLVFGWHQKMLSVVLELVHPGHFKALPPSPQAIAWKADMMGIAKYSEFITERWV